MLGVEKKMRGSQDVDVGYKFEEVPADSEEEEVGGVEENYELDLTGIEFDHGTSVYQDALASPLPGEGSADFEEEETNYYHHAAGRGSNFEYAVEDVTSYHQY